MSVTEQLMWYHNKTHCLQFLLLLLGVFITKQDLFLAFLPHDTMLARYIPSSCICLSVTLRYCIKTAKCRITQIMPRTLVLRRQRSRRNLNLITPYRGNKCKLGGLKSATFNEKFAITRKRYKIVA